MGSKEQETLRNSIIMTSLEDMERRLLLNILLVASVVITALYCRATWCGRRKATHKSYIRTSPVAPATRQYVYSPDLLYIICVYTTTACVNAITSGFVVLNFSVYIVFFSVDSDWAWRKDSAGCHS